MPSICLSAGVADPSCDVNSTSIFCVALDSERKCRYDFKPAGSVCDLSQGTGTCRGTGPSCRRDAERASRAACVDDKTQICAVPGLCDAAQGCTCNAARRSLAEGCICAEPLGFVPVTTPETGQSRCRWNVTFTGSRFISIPLNSRVALPVNIMVNGGTFCPPDGRQVIRSIDILEKTTCRPRTSVALGTTTAPLGETCGQYVFSTSKAGATHGSCWRAKVYTTDTRQYNLIVAYQ